MMVKVGIFSDCMFEGGARGTATHSNAHPPTWYHVQYDPNKFSVQSVRYSCLVNAVSEVFN